jgi:hypothetical protein
MFLIFHQGRIMKKLATVLASLILVLHFTACTSGDSKEEGMDGAMVEDLSGDALAQEDDGSMPPADMNAGTSEGFMDEQLPEDALGEAAAAPTESAPTDDLALDAPADSGTSPDPLAMDSTMGESADSPFTEPPPPDVGDTSSFDTSTPSDTASIDVGGSSLDSSSAMETPSDSTFDSSNSMAGLSDTSTTEEPKPKASLLKVESAPINRGGILLNAVYVARPKDTFKSISTMIYGTPDRAEDLKKGNSWISKVKPGNKVYYNSPVRPTDDTKVLTYYEDAGMSPEIYFSKEGDNIRSVSKDLLGYDNAWQEVWATNTVESKGKLPAGTELRYWKARPAAAMGGADVAMNTPPPMDTGMPQEMPQEMQEMPADLPPPPANDMAAMAPPPPQPIAELPPPPPPPPAEAMNPPPPPPPKAVAEIGPEEEMDKDVVMSFAGAGVIVLGLAAIMVARKRRQQRDMSNTFNDTQVGT